MIDYSDFLDHISSSKLSFWTDELRKLSEKKFNNADVLSWEETIESFPKISPTEIDLDQSEIKIGRTDDCSDNDRKFLKEKLMNLHPWRKGPYHIFGIHIDTEWRSDWKWDRLKNHIKPLKNKNVLDVGCGNGYHCWRMLGNGARSIIGIDPFALNVFQHKAIKRFLPEKPVWLLPNRMEEFPESTHYFDTVFSMGVLYHRRSPFDHLIELRDSLRTDGELILETLVIDGKLNEVLVPEDRYAKMRNVWFIPSISTLELWMKKIGFKNIRLADVSKTSINEQRSTEWMKFESLQDFFNESDHKLTFEGYPAPKRAIFIASV